MSNIIVVHKNRTNTLQVNLGVDVSSDELTSEIRSEPTVESPLIAAWEVSYLNDGVDGKLILTLDDLVTSQIAANSGYMDIKRVVGGEPVTMFDKPLEVIFRGTVTA